ncbi:putative membrane protein [Arcanobacterium wilhelmae]|uniref:Membrane protein n=1 Tax=Arcanobacterium wilhelmae TaxID=1803177 RepID=A0ABT9N9Q6_9ACTO|nr:DUF4126 domain-containing protein [Arcanobacterium wilhelmae]MDP9800428.1 putative membrane protein [Arcanobacterium wilhelmae]WFN89852.1 DUF4126 domain-containing protein [Arcanobacterium wilhelmae]
MLAAITGAGLAAAAGLNAYIPYLFVAVLARFTNVIELPASLSWISSWWSIVLATLLLLSEIVLDKIPAIDTVNDAVASFIRPATGGLIFAATTAAANFENSSPLFTEHPWIGVLLGIVFAGITHGGKMAARPVVNAGTFGLGAPVVSTAEDTTSAALSLTAVFFPVIALIIMVALFGMIIWVVTKLVRSARALHARNHGPREGSNIIEPRM